MESIFKTVIMVLKSYVDHHIQELSTTIEGGPEWHRGQVRGGSSVKHPDRAQREKSLG